MKRTNKRVSNFAERFQKRAQPSFLWQALLFLFSMIAALVVSSILILSAGASIPEALFAMLDGSFGGWNRFLETLVQATPLIFTGMAVTVAFRARLWNIGAEGQLVAGAMAAFWASMTFNAFPSLMLVPVVLLAAALGGALWGMIPGYLKVKFGADEIIVSVLLNYIILFLLSFLLSGPWRDPSAFFIQTVRLPSGAILPSFFTQSRLHLGFLIALIVAGISYVLLWKTPFGYEIRAIGLSASVANHKGINVAKTIVLVLAISGALAGLAGGIELFGIHQRLKYGSFTGLGFTGILVGLLGRLHPVGVVIAAIFFAALVTGSSKMQIETGVPVALPYAIQGIVLLFILVAEALSKYQLRGKT